MARKKASIKFTIGGVTTGNPFEAMEQFQKPAMSVKKNIGELTRVYDRIAPVIIDTIKNRFNQDTFGRSPFPILGSLAPKVKQARGYGKDNPALVGSGALRDSIGRRPGPTKTAEGGNREVYTLRVGSTGVPYARDVIEGSTWQVPVFTSPEGFFLIDYDQLEDSVETNESMYTENTLRSINNQYSSETFDIPVPARNIFYMSPSDEDFIFNQVEDFLMRLPLNQ